MDFERRDIDFDSQGSRCAAWLYLPAHREEKPPVVVMAHGFGGTREAGLSAFAERFAQRGLAVLVFDYRRFGDSEGEPRQWLDPQEQLADWRAALACARRLDEVDGARVGLWGTSFSGGHVLVTGAQDGEVRCIVSQVPFVDSRAGGGPADPKALARLLGAALNDWLRGRLGLEPHRVPIFGREGQLAMLNAPGCYEGYRSLIPRGAKFRNEVTARTLLAMMSYRPVMHASKLRCPLLILPAREDNLIPVAAVEALAGQVPGARVEVVDAGHFDVYTGELFEQVVTLEADFLVEHLAQG